MSNYQNPLARYHLSGEDSEGDVMYLGYTDREGKWYIQKSDRSVRTDVTYRYSRGDRNWEGNWQRRRFISYGLFKNVFKNTV